MAQRNASATALTYRLPPDTRRETTTAAHGYNFAMRTDIKSAASLFAIAVLANFLGARNIKAAQTSTCSDVQEKQALNLPDHYQRWDHAYTVVRQFKGCDDGSIGEGFSEAIAQLFIRDWTHLDAVVRLTSSDKEFKRFVLWHIDATLSDYELHAIIRNSRTRCPVKDKQFCKEVENAAVASLNESREDSQ